LGDLPVPGRKALKPLICDFASTKSLVSFMGVLPDPIKFMRNIAIRENVTKCHV
jgi:hypothetical protein